MNKSGQLLSGDILVFRIGRLRRQQAERPCLVEPSHKNLRAGQR
jgi:hypothetical protein